MPAAGQTDTLIIGRRRKRGVAPWLQGLVVALLVGASFCAIVTLIYWWAQSALITEIHSGLLRTAAIAARKIDVDVHQRLDDAADRGTPDYDSQAEPLRDIVIADPEVTFVTTFVLRDGAVHFVLDGTPPPPPGEPWPDSAVQVMGVYDTPPQDLLTAFAEARPIVSEPYSDEWGSYISAFYPLKDRTGTLIAVLGIDLGVRNYEARLQPIRRGSLAAAGIGVLIAVLMGVGVWFNRKTDRNARDLARQLRTVNALLAVSRALASGVNLGDLLPVIIKQTRTVMAAEHSALFLIDPRRGILRRNSDTTALGDASDELGGTLHGITGRVLRTGRPANVADAQLDPDFDRGVDQRQGALTRSLLAMPIIDRSGGTLGVMQVINRTDGAGFDDDDEILLGALGAQVVAALDRARLTEVYVEKQKLDEALKLAASIQMSMLARTFPPPNQGAVEIHACLVPAKDVGGDFYDFFWLGEHRLAFLVADVSGKGMPAALFMAKAKTLVKAHANLVGDPEAILTRANDELSEDNDNGMFVTLFLAILATDTGHVRYCNAGHNQPYRLLDGKPPRQLEAPDGIALGVMAGLDYHTRELQLEPGEALFLYTDGVNEAMDVDNNQFEYSRLEKVLAQPLQSAASIDDAVLRAVREFTTGAEPSDDLTLLTVRWRG